VLEWGSKRLEDKALGVGSDCFCRDDKDDGGEALASAVEGSTAFEKAGCIILSKYTENSCPLGVALVLVVAALAPPRASLALLGWMEGNALKELMLILCTLVVFCKILPGKNGLNLLGTVY
jgi:hypothetical protein